MLKQSVLTLLIVIININGFLSKALAIDVGKWKRFEISYSNSTWNGNAFDLVVSGIFTHKPSGSTKTAEGFYAGNNTWKIFFMPHKLGNWTFKTQSEDPDLNNKTGSFECVPSGLPGQLMPVGNRWKLADSGFTAPVVIQTYMWLREEIGHTDFDKFLKYAVDSMSAPYINQNFGTGGSQWGSDGSNTGKVWKVKGIEFNIAMFDRMNQRFDKLRDAKMGAHIMFYSDDGEAPGFGGQTSQEKRYFRYMVARFSPYPIVMWDSGIDIGEYRSNSWIDWFAGYIQQIDAYDHPIGSRSGGGSGGKHPNNATYYSDGTSSLPAHSSMLSRFNGRSVPTAFTDIWVADVGRGGFTNKTLRRALWEMGLVGGTSVTLGPNYKMDRTLPFEQRHVEAKNVKHARKFFKENILDIGALDPRDELVKSGGAILSANIGKEYVAYLVNGGSCSLDLSGLTGGGTLRYYDPKTGNLSSGTSIVPSANTAISAPSFSGDAVVWIVAKGSTAKLSKNTFRAGYPHLEAVPNPFNRFVKLKFFLPEKQRVTMTIYNLTGKRIINLVNKQLEKGHQGINWNANGFTSGMFVVKLQTGSNILAKKLLFNK